MNSYRPLKPYMHDGRLLHPKLTYALPPGLGRAMVEFGHFEKSDEPPDMDLSGMAWNDNTQRFDTLVPDPIEHPQSV